MEEEKDEENVSIHFTHKESGMGPATALGEKQHRWVVSRIGN